MGWQGDGYGVASGRRACGKAVEAVGARWVQAEFSWGELEGALDLVIFQVETVYYRGRLGGMDVGMGHFIDAVEASCFEERCQAEVGGHGLLMGFTNREVVRGATNSEMAAGGSIPPEDQSVLVVRTQVDVDIQRNAVGKVVVVKSDGFALEEIFLGRPHEFESPHRIKTESLSERLALWSSSVPVINRDGPALVWAHHRIVHLDEQFGEFGVNDARESQSRLSMFFAARGNRVAVVQVPALAVIRGAVKHQVGGAIASKRQEPAGGNTNPQRQELRSREDEP